MNQQQSDFISSISREIDKYSRVTDVSVLRDLLMRFLRTYDFNMQTFLLSRIYSDLNKLRLKFPLVDLAQSLPSVSMPKDGIEIGEMSFDGVPMGRFMLSNDDLNRNILIVAATGHGKTSLITTILRKLKEAGLTFLLFDMKRDYRFLGIDENTFYVDEADLKINPLEPPAGVPESEWALHFADVFSSNFSLLIGSRDFLLESVLGLYNNWKKDYPPSLRDLAYYLETTAPKNSYSSVTLGRIRSLLSSTKMFDCNTGSALGKLDKFNLVVGLDRLGAVEQGFTASLMLSYLYYMNMNDPSKRGKLYKVVVIDDAHTILDANKEKDYAAGLPAIHSIISKIRELGVGFIFADQQASALLSSAIQNTNLKFIGRINLSEDIDRLFGRNAQQTFGQVALALKQGEFIVTSQNISPYVVLRPDFMKVNKDVAQPIIDVKNRLNKSLFTSFKSNEEEGLESRILSELSRGPYRNISQHLSNMQPSVSLQDFNRARRRLEERGMIEEVEIELSPEKASKFLLPTLKARESFPEIVSVSLTKEDFIKELLRRIVLTKLKKAKMAFEEDEVGVLLKSQKKCYIVFMEDGTNLLKILETNFDRVWDVTDGSLDERSVLSKIFESKDIASLSNVKALSVLRIADFEPSELLK